MELKPLDGLRTLQRERYEGDRRGGRKVRRRNAEPPQSAVVTLQFEDRQEEKNYG